MNITSDMLINYTNFTGGLQGNCTITYKDVCAELVFAIVIIVCAAFIFDSFFYKHVPRFKKDVADTNEMQDMRNRTETE